MLDYYRVRSIKGPQYLYFYTWDTLLSREALWQTEDKRRRYLLFNILILIIAMEKKFYVAPAIEIEQIAIEKGFAASTEDPGNFPW